MRPPAPHVERVVSYFAHLTPADLKDLSSIYIDDAHFRDPFNDVRGVDAVRAVFVHMFANLNQPRFEILDVIVDGDSCFLTWNFRFRQSRLGAGEQCIHGGSLLRFGPDGRIERHRDYWDAAEELYQKLPLIGSVLRWLRRRASR